MSKVLKYYWPTGLVLLVIAYATLWPDPLPDNSIPLFPGADKLIHAIMMGGLLSAILFDRARKFGCAKALARTSKCWILVICMMFCVIDEGAQSLMKLGRESDPLDLLADWGGCIIAFLLAPAAIRKVLKNKP